MTLTLSGYMCEQKAVGYLQGKNESTESQDLASAVPRGTVELCHRHCAFVLGMGRSAFGRVNTYHSLSGV